MKKKDIKQIIFTSVNERVKMHCHLKDNVVFSINIFGGNYALLCDLMVVC